MNLKALTSKVSKFFQRLLAFIPSPLPLGVQDFNTWASGVLVLYNFPDNDSTRGALAVMITQLKPTEAYKPKRFFGLSLHTACAKEIAGNFYYDMKTKYQALAKAEKDAQQKTTAPSDAANVFPIQK